MGWCRVSHHNMESVWSLKAKTTDLVTTLATHGKVGSLRNARTNLLGFKRNQIESNQSFTYTTEHKSQWMALIIAGQLEWDKRELSTDPKKTAKGPVRN